MEPVIPESSEIELTSYNDTDAKVNGEIHSIDVSEDKPVQKTARFNIEKVQSPTPNSNSSDPISCHQNTVDVETIGYATHEALPLTMFYRNESSVPGGKSKARPTLAELHKGFDELDEQDHETPLIENEEPKSSLKIQVNTVPSQTLKFGWIKGVLVPCLLNIWGVILYLRLPWLTGQAGMLVVTCIILLSALVTTITTMSMSAICTNGEVKGGGAYYLISRSLGPEFGGSIGIIFSLANAVGVALYVVGFGETVQKLFERGNFAIVDKINDIRIIGIIIIIFLLGITLIGLDWVIRTQLILLLILILSMIAYVIGTFSGSVLTDRVDQEAQGLTSYSGKTFSENLLPEFRDETFFTTFSIFFPAATGILAGVNISGDLKDPQKAIPKGTFSAILLTTIVYILLAWMIGSSTSKDAMGVIAAVTTLNNQTSFNASMIGLNSINTTTATTTTAATTVGTKVDCIPNCKYGLLNDYQLMERFSLIGPLVLAGIFAATLSSALASLVGSPKTFQAVCRDRIFYGLEFFGQGSGPNEEPRRAYVLTFFISSAFILIGSLDIIAPVISNFFLMSYALINYSVFAASLGRSPGWRPSFKYYNMWLSLLGCFVCVGIMFLINWWAALVTIVIVMTLYKYVAYKKPQINWGSSGQAHTYIKALKLAHQLNKTDQHVKNFRPQCLVLTGAPSARPNLAHFVSNLTKHVGLMICGQVVIKADGSADTSTSRQEKWLQSNNIKSFASVTAAPNLRQGVQALMQCTGLGKLRPNIVVLGYKHDWLTDDINKVDDYINIIHDAFEGLLSVAVLRTPKDTIIKAYEDYDDEYNEELNIEELAGVFQIGPGDLSVVLEDDENVAECERPANLAVTPNMPIRPSPLPKKHSDNKGGNKNNGDNGIQGDIDVWWLFDDGGLTILLPYLLSQNKRWKGCSLRILTPASDKKTNSLKSNQVRMATLLKKFRITFSGVIEVPGINSKPSQKSIDRFFNTRIKEEISQDEPLDKKTLRQIRLGELLKEHSAKAQLIVLTMPVGRKSVVSNLLYMSWLDAITNGMENQILLVRGNQTSVLTFYS